MSFLAMEKEGQFEEKGDIFLLAPHLPSSLEKSAKIVIEDKLFPVVI